MYLDKLLDNLASWRDEECLVHRGVVYRYGDLERKRLEWLGVLNDKGIGPGAVIGLKAEYSIDAIGLLLALFYRRCIAALVPFGSRRDEPYVEDGRLQGLFDLRDPAQWSWEELPATTGHPLLAELGRNSAAGFIIFTSGSTGRPKAALHKLERFLGKFEKRPGKRLKTLTFLIFDHIAGLDTLFYTLAAGGTLVIPERRDPASVCRLIQDFRVEVLPASPTFLNLLCVSGDYASFDLSSLKIITYGSEPMGQSTLDRLQDIFPDTKVIQKYGTSELGSPRSLSRGNNSLWMKLKTDELEYKIVDGVLWLRSETAMLGYLNAPSPFDSDGWYCTGDRVEQDGDWIRILGRESEIIIVGGEKVYPQEVESCIIELDFVEDVVVKGESNPLTGQIVTARVKVDSSLDERDVRKRVRKHCRANLEPFKIPAKIEVTDAPVATDRQKKMRRSSGG